MPISTFELAHARDISAQLLDELDLDAWLFEVEPREGAWELRVECATDDGWEAVKVGVSEESLKACCNNETAHRELIQELDSRLNACKRRPPSD